MIRSLIPALLIFLTGIACKTKPVNDISRGGCGLTNTVWSAPMLLDKDSIKLSVTSAKGDSQIIIIIRKEGDSMPLETAVLSPATGKVSIDWQYDCDKYHKDDLLSLPSVYFTAGYRGSPCTAKSSSINVGARIRVENVDGRGEPEKNIKYELVGYSADGKIIHRINGKTDNFGMISRDDLIPCIRYDIIMLP